MPLVVRREPRRRSSFNKPKTTAKFAISCEEIPLDSEEMPPTYGAKPFAPQVTALETEKLRPAPEKELSRRRLVL